MTIRRIGILLVACFLTSGCDNESNATNQEPKTAEAKLVGDWLAQQYYSPEYVEKLHKMSPEGDRALLEEGMREAVQYSLMTLRFYADGTSEMLTFDGRPAKTSGRDKWTLSADGMVVSITQESPTSSRTTNMVNGKPVVVDTEGTTTSTMKLELSGDGQTLSDPNGEELFGMRYLKSGSDAAKKAFKERPEPPKAVPLADEATIDDYVGTWVGQITMPQEMWEGFRASMSEAEANKVKEKMEQTITLVLKQDMTAVLQVSGVKDAPKGKWRLKDGGPIAVLTITRVGQGSGPPEHSSEIHLTADKESVTVFDPERGVASSPLLIRKRN